MHTCVDVYTHPREGVNVRRGVDVYTHPREGVNVRRFDAEIICFFGLPP